MSKLLSILPILLILAFVILAGGDSPAVDRALSLVASAPYGG